MKAVIQRVKSAKVEVSGELISEIESGMLILLCIEKGDQESQIETFCEKVSKMRIFEDDQGKMNKSILDIKGSILLVSQFTLSADMKKGTRPSFDGSEKADRAKEFVDLTASKLESLGIPTQQGKFGAMMDVSLVNDGPVTFTLAMGSES